MLTRRKPLRHTVPKLTLPPRAMRGLERMGLGGELAKLNKALRGDSPTLREVERLCPPTTKLNRVFQSVSPRLSPRLYGRLVANFWSSLLGAVTLSENLHELVRIEGRSRRKELRLLLAQIYEVPLAGQRRQVEGLRRDIPRLIEELGGDPSKELLPHRRPRPRLAERGQGGG
jgi:hypothetical protein